jgi:hypothetical protein
VNFNGGRLPGRRNVPRLIAPTHDDAALMILRRKLTLRSRNHLDQVLSGKWLEFSVAHSPVT